MVDVRHVVLDVDLLVDGALAILGEVRRAREGRATGVRHGVLGLGLDDSLMKGKRARGGSESVSASGGLGGVRSHQSPRIPRELRLRASSGNRSVGGSKGGEGRLGEGVIAAKMAPGNDGIREDHAATRANRGLSGFRAPRRA